MLSCKDPRVEGSGRGLRFIRELPWARTDMGSATPRAFLRLLGLLGLAFGAFGVLGLFGVLGFWVLGFWVLGFWVLGFWVLGFWVLGFWVLGFWVLGFWALGFWAFGFWAFGCWGLVVKPLRVGNTGFRLTSRDPKETCEQVETKIEKTKRPTK